jgi:hypothetical protein
MPRFAAVELARTGRKGLTALGVLVAAGGLS